MLNSEIFYAPRFCTDFFVFTFPAIGWICKRILARRGVSWWRPGSAGGSVRETADNDGAWAARPTAPCYSTVPRPCCCLQKRVGSVLRKSNISCSPLVFQHKPPRPGGVRSKVWLDCWYTTKLRSVYLDKNCSSLVLNRNLQMGIVKSWREGWVWKMEGE